MIFRITLLYILFAANTVFGNSANIQLNGQTNVNGGTNYTVTGTATSNVVISVQGMVGENIHPSVIEYYLNLGKNVKLLVNRSCYFYTNISVNPSNAVSFTIESTGITGLAAEVVFAAGVSISSTGQALNFTIYMRSQNSGYSARAELNDLNLNTNGGDFFTTNIVSYDGTMPAMQLFGANINTGAGNITLYGYSHPTQSNTYGAMRVNNATLTTTTGTIAINGIIASDATNTVAGTRAINILGTTAIQSSTGNISINGSILNGAASDPTYITELANTGAITTAGNLSIEGYNNGTSTTPVAVYITPALSTTGNLVITGTDVYVSNNITLTGISKSLTINTAKDFNSLDANGRITFTTNNGDITINSDSDANSTGSQDLDYLTLNPGSGNTLLRSYTVSWTATLNTDKPYLNGTGNITIESNAASFGQLIETAWYYIDQDANGIGNLTIGKNTNNANISLGQNYTLNSTGNVVLYGSLITLLYPINLTVGGKSFFAKSVGNIVVNANITTNNGDVILWADSDNNNVGSIALADNISINTANGSTASNLSGGGKIVLAGGADNGVVSGLANDNIPDNYAQSNTANGLAFGTTQSNVTQFYSGGGDIILNGKSTAASGTAMDNIGFMQYGRLVANAGNGAILINGVSSNFYAVNFVYNLAAVLTGTKYLSLISNKSTGNAIQISGTSSTNYGVVFNYNSPKELLATGGGNIQITGVAGGANGVFIQNANILSSSGDINIDGGSFGINIPSGGARFGSLNGSAITSSSSNIKLTGNTFSIADPTTYLTNFITSGTITIEPKTTSFSSAFTWPSYLTTTSSTSGLTIGKLNNTANITISPAHNIAGPISIYGGALTLTGNLTSTNGDILIKGASATGAGTITAANGSTVTLDLSANSTFGGAINGTGANLVKTGAGATTLSASCGYTGSTTVNGGTLQFNEIEAFNAVAIANGATLALGPNKQFDFNSALVNNGTIILRSGATLLNGNLNTVSGSGSYVVEQAITGTNSGGTPNGRFWYLGTPISGAFSSAYNAGGPNVLKFRNESANQWTEITTDGVALNVGQGYYCQVAANSTLSFAGSALNNGAITISGLTRTAGQGFEGFNLVSNPYPSYLDWDAVTKTNVGNTMWYRTASSTTAASMVFETYVAGAAGGIGTNLSGNVATKWIPPMQSFWVRVAQGQTTGSIALDNTMRAHFTAVSGSTAGLRSTNDELKLFLRMNLLQADKKDQIIVYVNDIATNGFDQLDGEKMMQAGIPQFYTKAADKKITINGLNSAKKQQALPITMELPTTGVHSFVIEDLEIYNGLVWLEDKQEAIMQALEPGTVYEFYANSGINAERFVLHFQLLDTPTPTNTYNEVGSYANFNGKGASVHAEAAGVVVIKLPASTEGNTDIQIRDAAGKLVYAGSTNTLETSVQLAQANGIYYVTLNSASGVEVRKVFIQQ